MTLSHVSVIITYTIFLSQRESARASLDVEILFKKPRKGKEKGTL